MHTHFSHALLGLASLSASVSAAALQNRTNKPDYVARAHSAIMTLQHDFYNKPQPGFWSTGWWNMANCLAMIADLRQLDDSAYMRKLTDGTNGVFNHVVSNQQHNKDGALEYTGYFDDEGWWVTALIKVYDVTRNPVYLNTAVASFEKIHRDATPGPCGGIPNAYPGYADRVLSSSIATLLYIESAALLAARVPAKKAYYMAIANKQWGWISKNFLHDGIIAGDSLINPPQCTNEMAYLTYIEGVAMSALVAMSRATGNGSYLDIADSIATITISGVHGLVKDGIVFEFCDGSCNADMAQFKGILMRGLRQLSVARPGAVNGTLPAFMRQNSDAIWSKDRGPLGLLGQTWAGPFQRPATQQVQLASHSAATMALVQAALYDL